METAELFDIPKRPLIDIRSEYFALMAGQHEAKRNWPFFNRYLEDIRNEIRLWKAGYKSHDTLTALLWNVSQRVYNRGDGLQLMDFSDRHQRCFLRRGLKDLGKLLCREVEEHEARLKK